MITQLLGVLLFSVSASAGYGYYDYGYGYGSDGYGYNSYGYSYDPSSMYYYNHNNGLTYYSYSYYDTHNKQKFGKNVVVEGSLDGYTPAAQCPNGCMVKGKCGSKDECETANFMVLIVFCVIGGIIVLSVCGICICAALGKKKRDPYQNNNVLQPIVPQEP